jgi:4'-phosphopantetheinyl transferase
MWHPSAEPPPLPRDAVHVWRFTLERSLGELARLRQVLLPQEQQRGDRFHFDRDRRHFIAGRGLLRVILGHYLGRAPEALRFCYGPQGKPALQGEQGPDELRFNLSHSHGLALLALARGRDLGVDVEQVRDNVQTDGLAQRFFAPAEVAVLRSLPQEQRLRGFFRCWTRKEAYIKAKGGGLSLPLDRFVVSLRPDEPACLLATLDDLADASRWHMEHLDPGEDFIGAVLVEGPCRHLWCGQWPGG